MKLVIENGRGKPRVYNKRLMEPYGVRPPGIRFEPNPEEYGIEQPVADVEDEELAEAMLERYRRMHRLEDFEIPDRGDGEDEDEDEDVEPVPDAEAETLPADEERGEAAPMTEDNSDQNTVENEAANQVADPERKDEDRDDESPSEVQESQAQMVAEDQYTTTEAEQDSEEEDEDEDENGE